MSRPLLEVRDLTLRYQTMQGSLTAVDSVSFSLDRGQSLGLVGESGSGKTSLGLALMKLLPENSKLTGGRILLDGVDLFHLDENQMRPYRWNRISMVFQAAMNSLDPVYKVGEQIAEAIEAHQSVSHHQAMSTVGDLFDLIGLDRNFMNRYPHEYSGGMKQRAVIAMALSCEPDLVIADEPTTALDVISQDRILRQLRLLQKQLNMAMIYVTHDIGVVAEVTDYVGVMYAGQLVELGKTSEVLSSPRHPYTAALMSSFPSVTGEKKELVVLEGEPPDLTVESEGCRFADRCAYSTDMCRIIQPTLVDHLGHRYACWNPQDGALERPVTHKTELPSGDVNGVPTR